MRNDYDPVLLVKDATTFARSRFGRHHLAKLQARVDECTQNAINPRLSTTERGEWGLLASEAQRWLDYFNTAQKTASDPNMLERLAEGFKKRMAKERTDV